MEAEVAALEARLSRDGGTADDWTLLAKAYDFLGRPDDARRARARTAKPGAGVVTQMNAGALVAAATATETRAAPAAEPAPAAAAASVAELEARVKANPRDVQSWLALADLRRAQHDNRAARDALAKVIALKGSRR
jgi:cytochrome c-type biogenesis protein CcmH/NrfG